MVGARARPRAFGRRAPQNSRRAAGSCLRQFAAREQHGCRCARTGHRAVPARAVRVGANTVRFGRRFHQFNGTPTIRMKGHPKFSFERLRGIISKEFLQMRRDRLTFAMMLGIPLIQLALFGFAINSDPRHMPAAVLLADQGPQGRTLLYAMKNSTYFDFARQVKTEKEGHDLLARGQVQFVINIPENFSRDLLRGDRPAVLVEADATDPAATGNALGSIVTLFTAAVQKDLKGPLESLAPANGPIDSRGHARD